MRVGNDLLKFDDVIESISYGESICGFCLFFNVYNSKITSFSTLNNSCGWDIARAKLTGIGIPELVGIHVHPLSSFRFKGLAFKVTVFFKMRKKTIAINLKSEKF